MGTLLTPGTLGFASFGVGGGYGPIKLAGASVGGVPMANAKRIWMAPAGGPYRMRYSTPSATLSGGGANAASGASSAGRAQVSATANPGGNHSGDLSYSWGGGVNLGYINATSQTITGYYDFSGVSNGTTSAPRTDTGIFCDIKDNQTGAVWRTETITMGPLTWTNTIPAEDPISVSASGASAHSDGFGAFTFVPSPMATSNIASGGSGSYPTWHHDYVSGDTGFVCGNAAAQNPSFTYPGGLFCPSLSSASTDAAWRVTVTDSEGHQTSTTYFVSLSAESIND